MASFFDPRNPALRQYAALPLERKHVSFLPLAWTVVHKITTESPLYGITQEEFHKRAGEIMLQVSGIDQVSAQVVYTRTSYNYEDIDWGSKYVDMYIHEKHTGLLGIDMERLTAPSRFREVE